MYTVMPVLKGFVLGLGLIIPIGAQNSYVLSQSIKRNHHLVAATICVFSDFLLMALGVYGGSALIAGHSTLALIITWAGIAFLSVYGLVFFKSFYQGGKGDMLKHIKPSTRKVVIFTTLAVTFLNPHAYLDTVVIIGSISSQFDTAQKSTFLVGIMLASLVWFYTLALGAAKMSPWLAQEKIQRMINLLVAMLMWFIAWSLFNSI